MKPPSPRDIQTDASLHNRRETASEQTVIIGEGGGGAQNSLAGSAATPPGPARGAEPPAPTVVEPPRHAAPPRPAFDVAPPVVRAPPPAGIPNDAGHTRLLPYPGVQPPAGPGPSNDASKLGPVVGWLVVVDGPGKGNFRAVYPGSNTIGRASSQRIAIDFGDDSISGEKQAFLVYDGRKRQFQIVPNLEKSNLAHLNDSALLANAELKANDRITIGQTTLLFVPLCGPSFDWGEMK
jgi:hypothetical protein